MTNEQIIKARAEAIKEFAERLKERTPEVEPDACECCGTCKMMSRDDVEDIIDSIETVEIVRCRDCRWWDKYEGGLQGHCALHQMSPTGGWYCANGQKRGENDE